MSRRSFDYVLGKRFAPFDLKLRAAVGDQTGTEDQRAGFASSIILSFTQLVDFAAERHDLELNARVIAGVVNQARRAIAELVALIHEAPEAMAMHAKLHPVLPDPAEGTTALPQVLNYLTELEKLASRAGDSVPHRRTGPRDTFAVTLTTYIAIEYHKWFRRLPAIGRHDRPSPFDRACSVVEQMLVADEITVRSKDAWHSVTFSRQCKQRAIDQAKRAGAAHVAAFDTWMRSSPIAIIENHRAFDVDRILSP